MSSLFLFVSSSLASESQLLTRTRALYEAFARADTAWIPEFVSQSGSALVIGSDEAEWWDGYDTISGHWSELRREHGGTKLVPTRMRARVEGDVAWVVDQPTFSLDNGVNGTLRLTLLFRMETDAWRLVHLHASIPVPNDVATSA